MAKLDLGSRWARGQEFLGRIQSRARTVFEIVVLSSVLVASLLIIRTLWFDRQRESPKPPIPTEAVSIAGAPTDGDVNAPLALVVYSDFECPYCGSFARDTLPHLRRLFVQPGALAVVYKHFPLERIHQFARNAAMVGVCMSRGSHFWDWHDALLSSATPWSSTKATSAAVQFDQDPAELERCLQEPDVRQRIDQDVAEASRLGVHSTPTFLLGRRRGETLIVSKMLSGARPTTEFAAVIQELLGLR